MSLFAWLSIALVAATVIFYLIFAGFIYYWHEKKTSVVVIPLIFTFQFFSIGFLVICIITLAFAFGPQVILVFINR